jgi:Ca2+-binding EF-hand superfamily protein
MAFVTSGLWGFLGAWRQLFDRFDEDRSGYISYNEYTNALVAFGYHLTPNFISTMYSIYGRRRAGEMSFDLFVQSCISLKRMTDVFKRYDTDRDGFITLSFEEFLTGKRACRSLWCMLTAKEILNQR